MRDKPLKYGECGCRSQRWRRKMKNIFNQTSMHVKVMDNVMKKPTGHKNAHLNHHLTKTASFHGKYYVARSCLVSQSMEPMTSTYLHIMLIK